MLWLRLAQPTIIIYAAAIATVRYTTPTNTRGWDTLFPAAVWLLQTTLFVVSACMSNTLAESWKEFLVSTAFWFFATQWMWGPSLLQRLSLASGAQCVQFIQPTPQSRSIFAWFFEEPSSPSSPHLELLETTTPCLSDRTLAGWGKRFMSDSRIQSPSPYAPHFIGGFEASPTLFTLALGALSLLWRLRRFQLRAQTRFEKNAIVFYGASSLAMLLLIYASLKVSWGYHTEPEICVSLCLAAACELATQLTMAIIRALQL